MSSSTHSDGSGSMMRTVLSRLVPPGIDPSAAHTASGMMSATNACVAGLPISMVGDPAPHRQRAGLRVVDRLDGDRAGSESALEVIEERAGHDRGERFRHRWAVVRRGNRRHAEELGAVAARALGVSAQRREHRSPVHGRDHLGLRGRLAVGGHRHLEVDDVVRHRRADELRGDPLQRSARRLFGCFDRRRDP